MKLKLLSLLSLSALILNVGCAHYETIQTDKSIKDEYGIETRTITTEVKASTLFDSNSKLANFKANQTDKTQSTSVGSLDQTTTSTNGVAALKEVKEILQALPK